MKTVEIFTEQNFKSICDELLERDNDLRNIFSLHGYPPMWTRPARFQTLILIILEQQVSLASAYAAFRKLRQRIGLVTPQKLLRMSDEELRACYFSRQKIIYAKELARAVVEKRLNLKALGDMSNDEIRNTLKQFKGIGDWTVDIYLIHALRRMDVFPTGDLALVNSIREVKKQSGLSKEEILALSQGWQPYRTMATMFFWHAYICKRGIRIES